MAEDAVVGRSTILAPRCEGFPNELADYTLNNPDTLTKYKTAAQISHKVLEAVTGKIPRYGSSDCVLIVGKGWCLEGEKILSICERGDKLLAEEVGKVYKGKKISKGQRSPIVLWSRLCSCSMY